MHPYVTDSNEKNLVPLILVIASVLSAWLLNRALEVLQINLPWWIDAPSVVGFYGVFYSIFDKYLWQVPILQKIGLVKLPILSGVWKGYISSSFDLHAEKHDATIEIRQSWTRIIINLKTQYSNSHSLSAMILTEDPNAIVISYEYLNEPRLDAKASMHIHKGTTRLSLGSDRRTLDGEYYSGRDRLNFGVLNFRRL